MKFRVSLICCVVSLWAWALPYPSLAQSKGSGVVSGQLVDGSTGEPVIGAVVECAPADKPDQTKYATTAVFTSDNPRHESPEAILDDMVAGLEPGARYLRIADRAEAIRTAVMLSRPGDIILVVGKGHETYQIVGDVKHPFDDREEIKKRFALLN